jgi:hypothetical protein
MLAVAWLSWIKEELEEACKKGVIHGWVGVEPMGEGELKRWGGGNE